MLALVLAALRAILISRAALVAENLGAEQPFEKDAPLGRAVQGPELDEVVAIPQVGGRHVRPAA